jgi:hypothetical protein
MALATVLSVRDRIDAASDRGVDGRILWATHQAEYATDVLFTTRGARGSLYRRLLRHATLCLRAEDVLTFLGRELHGCFAGESLNDCKRRWRVTHVGHTVLSAAIRLREDHFPTAFLKQAA